MSGPNDNAWIGVDLDGTLAFYDKWVAWNDIGPIIPAMADRIKAWLAEGREVRIFTARVSYDADSCWVTKKTFTRTEVKKVIQDWLEANGLPRLEVTHQKDPAMIELWDDRAVQVVKNTGRTLAEEHLAEITALRGAP